MNILYAFVRINPTKAKACLCHTANIFEGVFAYTISKKGRRYKYILSAQYQEKQYML